MLSVLPPEIAIVSPSRRLSVKKLAAARPTSFSVASALPVTAGTTMQFLSRHLSTSARSRSKSRSKGLLMVICTIPSSRPCLIRRLTLAAESPSSFAISDCWRPSSKWRVNTRVIRRICSGFGCN